MFRSLVTSAQEMEEEDDNMLRSFFPQVTYVLVADSTCGSRSSDLNLSKNGKFTKVFHFTANKGTGIYFLKTYGSLLFMKIKNLVAKIENKFKTCTIFLARIRIGSGSASESVSEFKKDWIWIRIRKNQMWINITAAY